MTTQHAYTPQQVADLTGHSYREVMQAIHGGQLVARRKAATRGDGESRRYVVLAGDLGAWLQALPIA